MILYLSQAYSCRHYVFVSCFIICHPLLTPILPAILAPCLLYNLSRKERERAWDRVGKGVVGEARVYCLAFNDSLFHLIWIW